MEPEIDQMAEPGGAGALVAELKRLMEKEDVEKLKRLQLQILGRLENSHAVLAHFNESSARSYAEVASNFSRNTKVLKGMRSDLDYIFRKIRLLRSRISKHFPNAFDESMLQSIRDERSELEEVSPPT